MLAKLERKLQLGIAHEKIALIDLVNTGEAQTGATCTLILVYI